MATKCRTKNLKRKEVLEVKKLRAFWRWITRRRRMAAAEPTLDELDRVNRELAALASLGVR
jgi:hypothetical protein